MLDGGEATQCHVGPLMIVMPSPIGGIVLHLLGEFKQVLCQPIVLDRSVIALNVGILLQRVLTNSDGTGISAASTGPGHFLRPVLPVQSGYRRLL